MELKLYQIVIGIIAIFMIHQGGKDYLRGGNNQTFIKFFVRVVFLMVFKLLSAIERLEQQISILTRKDALLEIEQPDRKNTE
jgi:hypothetical protein